MNLYPAIDLRQGRCVRLERGDPGRATVFGDNPAEQARRFEDAGCTWLHVVDLDGAFAGGSPNADAISAVLESTSMRVQLGGGIRSVAAAAAWLDAGVRRVVLGTVAVSDPDTARTICRTHPGRVAIAADARAGQIAVEGWARSTDIGLTTLLGTAADYGAAVVIYTDIARDGVMTGIDAAGLRRVADCSPLPVVASGGVAGMDDLIQIGELREAGIDGVIVGRAIYEGRLDVRQAVRLLAPEAC